MKLLVVVAAVCLALLAQDFVALAQEDNVDVAEADNSTAVENNDSGESVNSTGEVENPESAEEVVEGSDSANDTAEIAGSDSPVGVEDVDSTNSTAAAEGDADSDEDAETAEDSGMGDNSNSTTAEDTESAIAANETDVVEPPSNVMMAPGNSSASNDTEAAGSAPEEDDSEPEEDESETPAAAMPVYGQNASDADMTLFGVSEQCADVVQMCYVQESAEEFRMFKYCDAYQKSKQCIAEKSMQSNSTEGNGTESSGCSAAEVTILDVFSCSPSDKVPAQCKARVTQCAAAGLTPEDKMAAVNDEVFKGKVCDAIEADDCLKVESSGAVCTENEVKTVYEDSDCNSSAGLISSFLLLALMFVVSTVM